MGIEETNKEDTKHTIKVKSRKKVGNDFQEQLINWKHERYS